MPVHLIFGGLHNITNYVDSIHFQRNSTAECTSVHHLGDHGDWVSPFFVAGIEGQAISMTPRLEGEFFGCYIDEHGLVSRLGLTITVAAAAPPALPPPGAPPATPPPPGDAWVWAQDQETCVDACARNGLLCDAKRARAEVMPGQETQAGLEAYFALANQHEHQGTFTWPGTCTTWVKQGWSPMPFYQTGNGKCYSSGISAQNGEYGYRCDYVNSNTGHRLCKCYAIGEKTHTQTTQGCASGVYLRVRRSATCAAAGAALAASRAAARAARNPTGQSVAAATGAAPRDAAARVAAAHPVHIPLHSLLR